MIKYNGKEMSANKVARHLVLNRGIHHSIDLFDPSECNDFGCSQSDMPTHREQELIMDAYNKQGERVRKYLGIL